MKIFNKFLFVIVLSGIVLSCDSITDINQPGNLPAEEAIQNVDDMNNALPGLYANLDEYDSVYFGSVFTDEITIGDGNGGQGLGGIYNFVLDETSAMSATVWNESYNSINALNRFITTAQEITPEDGRQDEYNDILGQAYAMRAYEYFVLLSYYSEDLTDDSSLGVIAFTDVPEPDAQRPRNTTGETFTRILDDIDTAESNIDPGASSTTRFTETALTALRARIATYRENYPLAETLTNQFVNDPSMLSDPQEYQDMYGEDIAGENIFKLERTLSDPYDQQADVGSPAGSGYIGNAYAQVTITQGRQYQVEPNLAALYDASDIRGQVSILQSTDSQGNQVLSVAKYTGNVAPDNVPLLNDQKIFRVSEMFLINAEAKVAQNDLPGAAGVIQDLRSARTMGGSAALPSYANQQEGFVDVLLERRKELAFEGHRWHDFGRIGDEANASFDRAANGPGAAGCSTYGACTGPTPGQSEKFVLPIPLSELSANSAISSDDQNPGY